MLHFQGMLKRIRFFFCLTRVVASDCYVHIGRRLVSPLQTLTKNDGKKNLRPQTSSSRKQSTVSTCPFLQQKKVLGKSFPPSNGGHHKNQKKTLLILKAFTFPLLTAFRGISYIWANHMLFSRSLDRVVPSATSSQRTFHLNWYMVYLLGRLIAPCKLMLGFDEISPLEWFLYQGLKMLSFPQSWKWKMVSLETKVIFQATIFHFHDYGRKRYISNTAIFRAQFFGKPSICSQVYSLASEQQSAVAPSLGHLVGRGWH